MLEDLILNMDSHRNLYGEATSSLERESLLGQPKTKYKCTHRELNIEGEFQSFYGSSYGTFLSKNGHNITVHVKEVDLRG